MPGLGRIYRPDSRDKQYLFARKLGLHAPTTGAKLYHVPHLYDQGQSPECVGYSCSGAMTATEAPATVAYDAHQLYVWANSHDGDPTPHDGSTVRAGLTGLVTVGDDIITSSDTEDPVGVMDKLGNYLWADTSAPDGGVSQVISWLLTQGPVVIGINWYNAAFTPDSNGYIHLTGGIAGGHAICVRGVNANDPKHTYFVLRNSWGPWGVQVNDDWTVSSTPAGDCLISRADLGKLLKSQGEAGALVATLTPPPATPNSKPHPSPHVKKVLDLLRLAITVVENL